MHKITLSSKTVFGIIPTSPFNFDGTFNKPSHYPSGLDYWEPGKYWQPIRIGERLFGLKIQNAGTVKAPNLKVTIFHDGKISKAEKEIVDEEVRWRFDLDADLGEFNGLVKRDKRFSHVFKRWIGMRISNAYDLYGLMIVAVLLQNATIRRTVQMTNTLLDKYGTKLKFDGKEVSSFWMPEAMEKVSEDALRGLKIGYRAKFIKRLSHEFVEGKVDEQKLRKTDQEQARESLMALYGVGPETARILMFEVCHAYDTFDHIAPWQQKIYSMLFYKEKLVPIERIQSDIKKRYGKYSMLAVHYIWEDIFWKRKNRHIPWLEREIRL